MISSQKGDRGRVCDFQGQNKSQDFDWERSSINVVSEEQVLSRFDGASGIWIDDFYKVIKLTMDIADDGDWVLDFY